MRVGLLVITHGTLGEDLLTTAASVLGSRPLTSDHLGVYQGDELEDLVVAARSRCERLDQGAGVLVLADLYGSTPGNVAQHLLERAGVRVVTGVNLPMLVRVLNYPGLDLHDIAAKALSGGHDGIVQCERDE